jgi:hypothetical protein
MHGKSILKYGTISKMWKKSSCQKWLQIFHVKAGCKKRTNFKGFTFFLNFLNSLEPWSNSGQHRGILRHSDDSWARCSMYIWTHGMTNHGHTFIHIKQIMVTLFAFEKTHQIWGLMQIYPIIQHFVLEHHLVEPTVACIDAPMALLTMDTHAST